MKIIEDTEKGLFEIKVDTNRKIIFEKNIGSWKKEDFEKFNNAYKNDLISDIKKMGKWAKVCDLREYKTSAIADAMNEHVKWASSLGFSHGAIVIKNAAIVKMQVNRAAKEVVELNYFDTEAEAIDWLKTFGY